MKKTLNYFTLLFIFAVILTSCEKEESLQKVIPEIEYNREFDILVFSNQKKLSEFISKYNLGEKTDEIDNDFVSQADLFNIVINEESKLENEFEQMYSSMKLDSSKIYDICKIIDNKPLEPLTQELINEGIIKVVKNGDSERFDLTTCAPFYSNVLNRNGLIKVGKVIFQYKENEIKMITDGDYEKIKLLDATPNNNSADSIKVEKIFTDAKGDIGYSNIQIQAYDKKIIVSAFLRIYKNLFRPNYEQHLYYYKFYCERKNWLGKWVQDTDANVYIYDDNIIKKDGIVIRDHTNGALVYHRAPVYSASFPIYADSNTSNSVRQYSENNVKWERNGGSHGFSRTLRVLPYNW